LVGNARATDAAAADQPEPRRDPDGRAQAVATTPATALGASVNGIPERILMSTAAAVAAVVLVVWVVPPIMAEIGHVLYWRPAAFAVGLLISVALLALPVVRPRSTIAAMGSALTVGVLLFWGLSAMPMSWPRYLLHLAAILAVAALLTRVIRGLRDGRLRVVWIVPCLLLGLPIGYLAGGVIGLHIWTQYCRFPLIGAEISSYLCSG
jgi:hypothetical protein